MNASYWSQKASLWVTVAVLAGGLVSAVILFFLVRLENSLEANYPEESLANPSLFSPLE